MNIVKILLKKEQFISRDLEDLSLKTVNCPRSPLPTMKMVGGMRKVNVLLFSGFPLPTMKMVGGMREIGTNT